MSNWELVSKALEGQVRGGGTYIKIVELWNAVLCDELGDRGVSLAHPSEELWHTHDVLCVVIFLL